MIRPIQCFSFLAAGLLFISCLAGTATADPTGTTFQLMLQNLGVDATADVVFDMDPTVVGNVEVSEMATTLPNGNDLVEFWIKKESAPLTGDVEAPFGAWITGLHWIDEAGNQVPGGLVENSAFVVFTIDGVPVPIPGLPSLPHPVDPTIPVIPLLMMQHHWPTLSISTSWQIPWRRCFNWTPAWWKRSTTSTSAFRSRTYPNLARSGWPGCARWPCWPDGADARVKRNGNSRT
jgi:hypothetical protein